jgi:hypothetical protein
MRTSLHRQSPWQLTHHATALVVNGCRNIARFVEGERDVGGVGYTGGEKKDFEEEFHDVEV